MAHGMKGEREYYLKRPGKGGLEPASSAKFNEKDGLFFSELLPPMECSDRREYKSISHPRAGKSLMLVVRDQDGTVVGYKLRKASSWDDWRAGEAVPNAIELRTLRFLRDQLKPNVDSALFAPQDSMLVEELYRTGDL
ncbi:MAG: hypothetical protein NTU61_02450, partial [Candidatus Altiarchaeota archaeon]|nr:hypothetical protein [Candidatus Altiarchaeota archaeon]